MGDFIRFGQQSTKEYDAEKTRLTEPDPRWTRFQAKLFLFPDGADQHADFLRQLGEEDNRTQQYVSHGFDCTILDHPFYRSISNHPQNVPE